MFLDKKVSDSGVTCNFRFRFSCCNFRLPPTTSRKNDLFYRAPIISKFHRHELTKTYAHRNCFNIVSYAYIKNIYKYKCLLEYLLKTYWFSWRRFYTKIKSYFQILQLLQREMASFR